MKKQIFKLTSILLAMVMVFSLFTIIPISAEGVDKTTAVSNLKTAWRALDYNSYMAKTVFNHCQVGAAAATWDATALTPALDAPDDAACTNNYVYNLAGSSSNNPVKVAALHSSASTSPIMPYDINEVDDMYFYYKTDDATEITTRLDFRKTDSTGSAWTNSGFNGTKNIRGTSGEWVKFSFNDYLALFGVTFSSRIINNGNVAHNLISGFGFALYTTSDTTISISNLFIDGDPNVAEARNFTDDEWIVKVLDTDLTELKAQYNDPEDSPTWTAFVDAFNVVKDSFGAEVVQLQAVKNLKNAWKALEETQKTFVNVLAPEAWWNASSGKNTATYSSDTTYGYLSSITGVTSTGYAASVGSGDPFLFLYGDGAKRFKLNGYKDLGFWFKATSDISARLHLTISANYGVTETVLTGDNEWHFVSLREVMGETIWTPVYALIKDSGLFRIYVDMGAIVDPEVSSVNVTFGGAYATPIFTGADGLEGEDLVVAACNVDLDRFADCAEKTAFESALSAALEFYPELKAEVGKANSVADLKVAWQSMTYTKNFNLGIGYYGGYKPAGTLTAYAVDDAPAGFAPVPSYKFNYAASAMLTGYSLGIDGKTSMVPFKMDQISDIKVWYKSTGDVTASALVTSTDLTNSYSIGTTGAKTLPSTNGEWKQISYIEWFESAFATTWSDRIINYTAANNSTDTHFVTIGFGVAQADVDITFGAMTIVPTINVDLQDSASWSNAQWVVNSFDIDLADYADGDAKETFKSAREAAKGYYTENFAAQDVIDAANKLGGIGLKPSTLIEHAQIDEGGVWAGACASYSANTNYLSNNGDQYVTINTEDFGNPNCSPDSGAVQYEAVTEGGIKLADIDDIFFSYKIENFVPGENGSVAARIWFYNENYSRYLRTKNEETGEEEFVRDDEGNKILDRGYWQTGMEKHGTTRYFAVDADTDGWVTTSIATIFGSDWKTHYLGYLNGSDIKPEDFTADNTYITKLALGFNGYDIEGDYADVSLGSMYLDYADDRFAIDANCADPAAVLAEALALDVSDCKKADADAFKKAVKALADELEADVTKANCVAGNKTANLVDLSLLSRYVDAVKAEKVNEFLEDNYIDLKAADINGDKVVDEADVAALRVALLG